MAHEENFTTKQLVVMLIGCLSVLSAFAYNISDKADEAITKQILTEDYTPRQCYNQELTANPFIAEACSICDKKANIKKLSEHSFVAACMGPAKGILITATEGFELKRGKVLHLKLKSPYISHSDVIDI